MLLNVLREALNVSSHIKDNMFTLDIFFIKVYNETQLLCQHYAKTKGVGTQAIPERHAFFINLGKIIDRYNEKCQRENTMM